MRQCHATQELSLRYFHQRHQQKLRTHVVKKEYRVTPIYMKRDRASNPMKAKTAAMIAKTTNAMTAITRAFSQPVSKKCRIKVSQRIKLAAKPRRPCMKTPSMLPIMIPMATIQTASVNLAFSFPTIVRPTSHNTGETTITPTITLTASPIRLETKPKSSL